MTSSVSVTIVTCNSAGVIGRCLPYVLNQNYPNVQIVVVDNASHDETPQILRQFEQRARIVYNRENMGFAAGQNQAIALTDSDWVLALNPDVRLTPNFIATLVAAADPHPEIGSVSGKLLSATPDLEIPANPALDSTGIYFTPGLRHFDRGSRQFDDGRYDRLEYVFGVTGAAALYRRTMIRDVSISGEFFDSDFFAYREDADLAWRAQLLGWKCLYTPRAVAYHVRRVLPENRRSLPAILNMHSVKNRFLMRVKNITPDLYLRHLLSISFRDALVLGGCLLSETASLRAFPLLLRSLPRTWSKRKEIMRRRRVTGKYMRAWFAPLPVSYPAPELAASPVQQVAHT